MWPIKLIWVHVWVRQQQKQEPVLLQAYTLEWYVSLILNPFYTKAERLCRLSPRRTGLALFTQHRSEPAAAFKARVNDAVSLFARGRDTTQFLLDRASTAVGRRQAVTGSTQAHTCMQTHSASCALIWPKLSPWCTLVWFVVFMLTKERPWLAAKESKTCYHCREEQ